ncbi:hypothetical protein [Geitlerinema sp. PCC 9228]|jgi:hypothetical protein|uniref:hypothetical protein n=1 Tax=Geitlerinema sp. PCC 9228 TaxID=111611 RepID=UPI001481AEAD|nr:hypothetical protein [Geitlerinema sp. PCC 9228]
MASTDERKARIQRHLNMTSDLKLGENSNPRERDARKTKIMEHIRRSKGEF